MASHQTRDSEPGGSRPADDPGKRKRRPITTTLAIGVALLQPELFPGIAIGVAAVAIPKYFPEAVARLQPLAEGVRRAAGGAAVHGRSLRQKARGLGLKTRALGQKLGARIKDKARGKTKDKVKEMIAHVTGRTVPSESGQPA